MGGLRTESPRYFFVFFAATLIQQYISVCFAMFCASISRDFTTAALFGNLGYTLQSMACGFFVNSTTTPVYVRWTKWIAYVYYAFGTLISNQFNGFVGDCPFELSDVRCAPYTGQSVIESLGFPQDWILVPLFVNVGWAVGFYLAAYFLLKYVRVSVSVSKTRSKSEVIDATASTVTRSTSRGQPIDVDLHDIKLSVIRRKKFGLRSQQINILQGVSASFVPGSINAILGPSGSGKSSLLNFIADRLHSSAYQKYISSGDIIFNNTLPSRSVIRSLCSYVTQEDDGLLPSLTVRETLHYAAYLRLPNHFTHAQKRARADDVILQMGLKDCADTLIGDEMVKGISGGEKRRVTISIQLLNDPKVLLLDEPTSGLDSFTAASILQVLRNLAEEGRTVICTIHQPRSDLFAQFGNILLLAKGGKVAYNGKSTNMLDYFSSLSHPCPRLTNPADHVLDLVSVNLQSEEKESISRVKVNRLLDTWQARKDVPHATLEVSLPAQFSSHARHQTDFFSAYGTLLRRSTLNFSRSPHMIVARVMQVVGIGIIFCLFFAPLKDDYMGITNRLGLVQEITCLYFVGMLNNMAIYPHDRSVFYREHDDNVYGVLPFFLVYLTLEVPFEIVTSLLFSVFLVIIPGLPRTPGMFFACSFCTLVIVNCGESIGIAFNTLFLHEGFAVNLISVFLSIGSLMAGIISLNMPGFLKGVNWLSPLKYSVSALINLAFAGQTFSCEGQVLDADGGCQFDTGDKVLESYGLTANVPAFLGAAAVCLVVYRILAFAILKIDRLKLGMRSFSRNN
jgi:ABC-type multidrug transport system ATPase subunit